MTEFKGCKHLRRNDGCAVDAPYEAIKKVTEDGGHDLLVRALSDASIFKQYENRLKLLGYDTSQLNQSDAEGSASKILGFIDRLSGPLVKFTGECNKDNSCPFRK